MKSKTATKTHVHPMAAIAAAPTKTEARKLASAARLTQTQAVDLWTTIQAKRKSRKASLDGADPQPKPAQDRWRAKCVRAAYRAASYRTATHSHAWDWTVSDCPGASSDSSKARPSDVGLPNAYSKQGFWVATSDHRLAISRTWLRDVQARGLACLDGMVTLACSSAPALDVRADGRAYAAVWARQGRGTSLVTERGWLVQVGKRWTHAGTVRSARTAGGYVAQVASWTGPLADCLAADPRVTFRDARAAGLCASGIRDWAERHNAGSLRPIRAGQLWRLAQASGDRSELVERAIRQAMGRLVATMERAA